MSGKTEQQPSDKKGSKREFLRYLGILSTVGVNLVVSTFVGFALGYFVLDKFLGTFPWFTIIFLILGIIAGFKYLFKVTKKIG